MLEYIKQQLAQRQAESNVTTDTDTQMDDAILEYAHLVDELSDLTMEGMNELRERPILDIPIEDDIELDSIEMSITSNRVMDIPSDIAAMESAYDQQKTYQDFYTEAYNTMTKLPRENEDHFVSRVKTIAEENYNAYMEYVIQEGLFGNDMMSIDDNRIPRNAVVNFGKYHGGNYISKIPVAFEANDNNQINIQQLRASEMSQSFGVFEESASALETILENNGIYVDGEVWDVATPVRLIVPKFNGDYRVVLECEVEDGNNVFVCWGIPESQLRHGVINESAEIERPVEKIDNAVVNGMNLVVKSKEIINEYVAPKITPSRWGNNMVETDFIQEAIDFGGGDNADNPPEGNDAGASNDNPPGGEANITPDDTTGDTTGGETTPSVDAQPAAVNDVSDAVASKVSNDANKNSADLGMNAAPTFDSNPDVKLDLDGGTTGGGEDVNNLEPDMSGDTSNDMGATDNFDTPTVDDSSDMGIGDPGTVDAANNELNGMDDTTNATSDLGGGSMENIDDMSIDDLLAKGEEKLKGMSIGQLKDFLNDGLGGGDELGTEPTTESADNSITNRINVAVRKCLGTLNDSKKDLNTIIQEFSGESKKLNALLGQANNASHFSDEDKSVLKKCNQSLTNLRMKLSQGSINNNKNQVVPLLKEFANDSRNVVKMCEASGKQITQEYAMNCETDEFGIIQ